MEMIRVCVQSLRAAIKELKFGEVSGGTANALNLTKNVLFDSKTMVGSLSCSSHPPSSPPVS